jgi:hypothetical protein
MNVDEENNFNTTFKEILFKNSVIDKTFEDEEIMKQEMFATFRNKGNFCVEFGNEINELEIDQES